MGFPVSQLPIGTPEQTGRGNNLLANALQQYQNQVSAKYAPQMFESMIQQRQAGSQKNLMISELLRSMMGGSGEGFGGQGGSGNNMKAAALKAFTGIDPFLMSPQESQNLKIQGQTNAQANKNNLSLGSSNVVREYLQDKMEMPQEYLGATASTNMAKDAVAARLGDKSASERLVKAAVIQKLLPEYVGAQLGSQGIKTTVPALAHQEHAIKQGWGNLSKFLTEHMTPEMHAHADALHNKYVKEINKKREEFNSSVGKRSQESMNQQPSEDFSEDEINAEAKYFGVDPGIIKDAMAAGVKNEEELKDFIKELHK